jgi:GxxExxY protein
MELSKLAIPDELKSKLKAQCYDVIACMHETHKDLGPGMPEYIYQEALVTALCEHGHLPLKEHRHHPIFHGKEMDACMKMDIVIPMDEGNIVVECKALSEITAREQFQLYGYLRATEYPIGILVNFGTWPKAQIQRFYYDKATKTIHPF